MMHGVPPLNRGKETVMGSTENQRRTMNSNRLAVFSTSLQRTDQVKAVSRGTDRSDAGDSRDRLSGICRRKKNGERGGLGVFALVRVDV